MEDESCGLWSEKEGRGVMVPGALGISDSVRRMTGVYLYVPREGVPMSCS